MLHDRVLGLNGVPAGLLAGCLAGLALPAVHLLDQRDDFVIVGGGEEHRLQVFGGAGR